MVELRKDRLIELDRRLRERERALRDEIRDTLLRTEHEHYKDLAGMVTDAGDESVADLLADLDIAAVDRDVGELREVESARARMRDGSYGACADCGRDIGHARLDANPTSARCVDCQTRHERASAQRTASL